MNNAATPVGSAGIFKLSTIVLFIICGRLLEASPTIEFVGMAAPDVIEIAILAGRVSVGKQVRYVKQKGDVIEQRGRNRYLHRDGKKIAVVIGPDGDILRLFDTFSGRMLETKWADNRASYWIESPTDVRYRERLNPIRVHRKSRPTGVARTDDWRFKTPIEHHVYLVLPHPLKVDLKYEISFAGGRFARRQFTFEQSKMRSEAVHVSHIGFHPDDPAKVAFLSCWMGNGGGLKYAADLRFHVVDDSTGAIVHSGKTLLSKSAAEKDEDAYRRNFNLTDVYEMDFTSFNRPGRYRICVEAIGCSYPFVIDREIWENAFRTSARGFYHQRKSGLSSKRIGTYSGTRSCASSPFKNRWRKMPTFGDIWQAYGRSSDADIFIEL